MIAVAMAGVVLLVGIASVAAQQNGPSVTRSFNPASVAPGGTVTVTIQVANYGGIGRVTETLPAGFVYVSSTHDSAGVSVNGQEVRFTLQGDSSVAYTVTASRTAGSHSFSGTLRDSDRANHTVGGATSVTVTTAPEPSATRSFNPASVAPGGTVTVTIQVANYGGIGRVTETLPAGFAYVSSTHDPAGVSESGQEVRFTLQGDSSVAYTVTASRTAGSQSFSGMLRDSDRANHTVGGATGVTVAAPPRPRPSGGSGGGGGGGTTPTVNRQPVFIEGTRHRSIAEGSPSGTNVGGRIAATDPENDLITYSLVGTDAESFTVDSKTGQIAVGAELVLDYETKDTYSVVIRAADPSGATGRATVTISVTNVDEAGTVTLSSTQPKVGIELTAALTDPDGGVTVASWQWQRSADGTTWTDVAGATAPTYTPTEADAGMRLRANVTYSDRVGSGITLEGTAVAVPVAPTPTPTQTPTPEPGPEDDDGGFPIWAIVLLVVGVPALIGGGWYLLRRLRA